MVQSLLTSVHEAAQTLDIYATLVDFHLDFELFIRRLHRPRFHIAFAALLIVATSRMRAEVVTNETTTVMARQLLDDSRYHFSHFRL